MVQRSSRNPEPPKKLAQHIALLLVTRAIIAGNNAFNGRRQGILWRKRRSSSDDHVQTLQSKTHINACPERIDDIPDLYVILIEFSRVSENIPVTPRAFGISADWHSVRVERCPLEQLVGMDGDVVRQGINRAKESEPKINGILDRKLSEGEQTDHIEVEKVRAISDLVEITYPKAGLHVSKRSVEIDIGIQRLELLHSGRAK